jgi:hypothetical protein
MSASKETDYGEKNRDSILEKFWELSPHETVKADPGIYTHTYTYLNENLYCIRRAATAQLEQRQSYVLQDRGIGVQFPAGTIDVSLIFRVQGCSGSHSTNRNRGHFPSSKVTSN